MVDSTTGLALWAVIPAPFGAGIIGPTAVGAVTAGAATADPAPAAATARPPTVNATAHLAVLRMPPTPSETGDGRRPPRRPHRPAGGSRHLHFRTVSGCSVPPLKAAAPGSDEPV